MKNKRLTIVATVVIFIIALVFVMKDSIIDPKSNASLRFCAYAAFTDTENCKDFAKTAKGFAPCVFSDIGENENVLYKEYYATQAEFDHKSNVSAADFTFEMFTSVYILDMLGDDITACVVVVYNKPESVDQYNEIMAQAEESGEHYTLKREPLTMKNNFIFEAVYTNYKVTEYASTGVCSRVLNQSIQSANHFIAKGDLYYLCGNYVSAFFYGEIDTAVVTDILNSLYANMQCVV